MGVVPPRDPTLPPTSAAAKPPAAKPPATSGLELAPGVRVMPELVSFTFARSSGPGGQNVNKVSTKAVLRIRVADLPLPEDAVTRLRATAGHRLVGQCPDDELLLTADGSRSQEGNKDQTLADLRQMLIAALKRPKRRRATKPSRGAKLRRLDSKRRRSETKQQRRNSAD